MLVWCKHHGTCGFEPAGTIGSRAQGGKEGETWREREEGERERERERGGREKEREEKREREREREREGEGVCCDWARGWV